MNNLTTTPKTLPALASDINAEHAAAERAINDALIHARNAGRMLIEAKAQVRHGEWGIWVTENFAGAYRTAQKYMRIAGRWSEIQANTPQGAHLNINDTLALIAEPYEDDPVTPDTPEPEPAPAPVAQDAPEPDQWPDHSDEEREPASELGAAGQERKENPPARNDRAIQPRAYTYRMQDLIRTAIDASIADDDEMRAVPVNDLMLASVAKTRDTLTRFLAIHGKPDRTASA